MLSENLSNLSSEVGVAVERTLFSACSHTKALAENPIIKSGETTTEEKLYEMQKVQDFYRLFEDITLVNPEGVVLVSTTYQYWGEWKYKEWFQRARAGERTISSAHAILYPFELVVIVAVPIVGKDGAVKAVLAGQVNMEKVWEITDKVKIGKTGFIFVIDKAGNLIAFPDKKRLLCKLGPRSLREEILAGRSGTAEYLTAEGASKLCHYRALEGYRDYKGQGWRIGIIQDVSEAYVIINKIQKETLAVAIGGVLFMLLLAVRLTRNIIRPIKILTKTSEKIAQGDLDVKVPVETRDEIGDLGNTFNKMTEDLKRLIQQEGELIAAGEKAVIIDAMPNALVVFNLDGEVISVNPAYLKMSAHKSPDEIVGKSIEGLQETFVNPNEDIAKMLGMFKETIEKGFTGHPVELKFRRSEGAMEFIASATAFLLRNTNGNPKNIVVTIRDITEQKRAEEVLKQYQFMVESAHDAIFFKDFKSRYIIVNNKTLKAFGLSREDIIGKNDYEIMPNRKEAKKNIEDDQVVFKTGKRRGIIKHMTGADGKESWFQAIKVPQFDDRGNIIGLVGIARDITELKRVQEKEKELAAAAAAAAADKKRAVEIAKAYKELKDTQAMLIQAEKMSAVGQLASGVAHEVKNPLAIIIQSVNYLEKELDAEGGERLEVLNMIKEAIRRADKIIHGLLEFSRVASLEYRPGEINKVIKASLDLVEKQVVLKNIKIIKELAADAPLILMDENQMEQVFVNVILNSLQSMPEGGCLTLRTYTRELKELKDGIGRKAQDLFLPGEAMLICEVEDTGAGIPKDKLDKVFDPFFTSRPPGEGTGLGLSITRSIVESHKGLINIESEEEKGTKFTITLPIAKGE